MAYACNDHGHTRSVDGAAIWSDADKGYVVTADGLDLQKPCRLVARPDGKTLTLEDAGGYCREVYCGVGGTFDGLTFKKK